MPDKRLVVIGDGSEMPKVKKKAASNIEILGYQPDQVLHDYMRRAKAFVLQQKKILGLHQLKHKRVEHLLLHMAKEVCLKR